MAEKFNWRSIKFRLVIREGQILINHMFNMPLNGFVIPSMKGLNWANLEGKDNRQRKIPGKGGGR